MTDEEKRLQWKDKEIQRLLMDLRETILTRYLHYKTKRKKKATKSYKTERPAAGLTSHSGPQQLDEGGVISTFAAAPPRIRASRKPQSKVFRTGTY